MRSRTSQFHQRLRNIAHTDQGLFIQTIDTDAEIHVMQTKLCAKRLIKTNHQDPTTSEPALTDAKSDVAGSDKRDNSVRNRVKPSETSCLVHKNATSINGRTNQNIELITVERQGRRSPKEVSPQGSLHEQ